MGAAVQGRGRGDLRSESRASAQLGDDLRRRLGNSSGNNARYQGYDHRFHTPGSETPGPVLGHCQVDAHEATQAENQEGHAPRDPEDHQRDAWLIRQERSKTRARLGQAPSMQTMTFAYIHSFSLRRISGSSTESLSVAQALRTPWVRRR